MIKPLLSIMMVVAALVLEISALATLWPGGIRDSVLLESLLQHSIASALLALTGWFWIPERFRHPRWAVLLLLFNFSFFMSVMGLFGMYLAALISTYRLRKRVWHPFEKLILPEFVLTLREPEMRASQGGIKSRLAHSAIPTPQRLQSLLALQGIPARISSPLLQDMLGDSSDDIRLVAYGLLDSREKTITAQIHRELLMLKNAEGMEMQLIVYKRLAELYWEMIYAGLAQGDLRIHSLNQALSYTDNALKLESQDTGMLFLKGRIMHELKRYAEAQALLELAMQHGLPEFRVLPYIVEIAYDQGDYPTVKRLMARLSASQITPVMKNVINFWVRRPLEPQHALPREFML